MTKKELTKSRIERQNVLNNSYAVQEIQHAVGLRGILFEGEYRITRSQVASFYGVSERTIISCTQNNIEELQQNGYDVLRANRLKLFELASKGQGATEVNFTHKTRNIAIYTFRAFLDIAMLLTRSENARQVRSLILDIVIDTINKRTGGSTKYINQRDEDFLVSLLSNNDYRKEFVDALTQYIDLGKVKYMIYTNKVYRSIFREDADEYRRVLRLESYENERSTMYSEVLDLIASYEAGYAEELRLESERLGRKLTSKEADAVFARFESQALWAPLREKARQKMASRDLCFRDALHANLQHYIDSVPSEDFERFLGEGSMPVEKRIEEYVAALERLKNRD